MRKAQAKLRELKAAGIPVSSETFGSLLRASNAEARAECAPVSNELTPEQMTLVKKVCPPCAGKFVVVEGLKHRLEELAKSE
jgi:Zn finger protein HypA/HybF involved in hydrogenase expression